MYRRILIAVENSTADRTILEHVEELARLTGAALLLVHVADGWVARNFDQLQLRESEEMKADRAYLADLQRELTGKGFSVETRLAAGDPADELIRVAGNEKVDMIAMTTHGHRFLSDLIHGTTADKVRHLVKVCRFCCCLRRPRGIEASSFSSAVRGERRRRLPDAHRDDVQPLIAGHVEDQLGDPLDRRIALQLEHRLAQGLERRHQRIVVRAESSCDRARGRSTP